VKIAMSIRRILSKGATRGRLRGLKPTPLSQIKVGKKDKNF